MKRFILVILLIVISVPAFSQIRFRGSDGWGCNTNTRYEQLFNNFALETFTGSVSRVDTITPMTNMSVAVRLILAADGGGTMPIHLGPAWFVLNQDLNFPSNDKIEVRGSRASISGSEFVMAVEVRRKDRILRFRDDDGNPFWCVFRRR
ncbi:MAG: DNA-binding protein [Chitinispirillia bacterium]|nr:DNA-binding protein [Chitinispirillia bacterium]